MGFMSQIIDKLNSVGLWFYELYLDAYYTGFPLDMLANFFYFLSEAFYSLAWHFYYFSLWVTQVTDSVATILSWDTIWSYILFYVPNLEAIRDWFYYWINYVWNEVDSWWSITANTVHGWIATSVSNLELLLNQTNTWLSNLQSSWDNFTVSTLPTLANWTGVESLISSWFTNYAPFWEGWQEWRDKVAEFFSDPEDWLYKALDRIIERFW